MLMEKLEKNQLIDIDEESKKLIINFLQARYFSIFIEELTGQVRWDCGAAH